MVGFWLNFLVLLLHSFVNAAEDFDYEKKGPAKWPEMFQTCVGVRQSPINIITSKTIYDSSLKPISIRASTKKEDFTLVNDGHKITLKVPPGQVEISYTNGFNFEVASLHWHWGKINGQGAEHTVDGKSGPIELHIVSWSTRLYKSFQEAATQPNGLSVIGLIYEVTNSNDVKALPELLTNAFSKIKQCTACATGGSPPSVTIPAFDLTDLLPAGFSSRYYRYAGSLTTPPCTENVLWNLLAEKKPISLSQLTQFRNLAFPNGNSMVDNFRPPQPLNPDLPISVGDRMILRSFS